MPPTTMSRLEPKLSISLVTFNRAKFIGATIESILPQMTSDCELVILDCSSNHDTENVVSDYVSRSDRLRYIKQETNEGIDRDYDRALELARGEFCWPMTDDDFLKPGAVAKVLDVLRGDISLIIVDSEARDLNMLRVLQRSLFNFESDRLYKPWEIDRLFSEVGVNLNINSIIVRRSVWLARERARYFGSLFIYLGVIFQEPLPGQTLVIAEPMIIYRMGNAHTFSAKRTEVIFVNWPSLLESLALSDVVKRGALESWRSPRWLLVLRALGFYSLAEYRRWLRPQLRSTGAAIVAICIALLPGAPVNALFVMIYSIRRRRGHLLQFMKESRFYFRNWLPFRRES